jgi:adenylate kinase
VIRPHVSPGFARRLAEYKARNNEDNTIVNFFDLLEIHPIGLLFVCHGMFLTSPDVNAEDLKAALEEIKKTVGAPRNYGPTPEQRAKEATAKAQKEVR